MQLPYYHDLKSKHHYYGCYCYIIVYMQGHVKPKTAAEIACRLWEMGCYEVSMGDTIGVGTPASVSTMFKVCPAQLSLVACFQTLCLPQWFFMQQK